MERQSKTRAVKRLKKSLGEIPDLEKLKKWSPEFMKWARNTEVAIGRAFGENSRHVTEFRDISYSLAAFTTGTPEYEFQRAYRHAPEPAGAGAVGDCRAVRASDRLRGATSPGGVQIAAHGLLCQRTQKCRLNS